MFENTYFVITVSIVLFILLYRLLIYPINKCLKLALDVLLGKEIARTLYQKVHLEYTYDNKYRPDDLQSQLILSSTLEEFTRICHQKQGDIQ